MEPTVLSVESLHKAIAMIQASWEGSVHGEDPTEWVGVDIASCSCPAGDSEYPNVHSKTCPQFKTVHCWCPPATGPGQPHLFGCTFYKAEKPETDSDLTDPGVKCTCGGPDHAPGKTGRTMRTFASSGVRPGALR
jgi:hypothetical protein